VHYGCFLFYLQRSVVSLAAFNSTEYQHCCFFDHWDGIEEQASLNMRISILSNNGPEILLKYRFSCGEDVLIQDR
jgi:hypothetical protein